MPFDTSEYVRKTKLIFEGCGYKSYLESRGVDTSDMLEGLASYPGRTCYLKVRNPKNKMYTAPGEDYKRIDICLHPSGLTVKEIYEGYGNYLLIICRDKNDVAYVHYLINLHKVRQIDRQNLGVIFRGGCEVIPVDCIRGCIEKEYGLEEAAKSAV